MTKAIIIFFFVLKLSLTSLFSGSSSSVFDDISTILDNKKIHLSLNFDNCRAIYKNHLMFSFDDPKIRVKKLNVKEALSLEYIPSFRKSKKVYFLPFDVELDLVFLCNDKAVLESCLLKTSLFVSCFVLDKTGRTRPKNVFVGFKIVSESGN